MKLLNDIAIKSVSGGDGWDVAVRGLAGGGIGVTGLGFAATVGFAITFPVALGVVATGAAIGAAWEFFTDDE